MEQLPRHDWRGRDAALADDRPHARVLRPERRTRERTVQIVRGRWDRVPIGHVLARHAPGSVPGQTPGAGSNGHGRAGSDTVGGMIGAAVVLMAYGSPERLADVPAYYSDIRGGRPIRPELLEDLVERYRRLGVEDGSPLNAITEETRAALEQELGLPVFTGMKHWQPRIAEAAEQALAAGAERIVGLVLAPHYSELSIAGYRRLLEQAL